MPFELTFFRSKDGRQNASLDKRALHSRYSIEQECRRFFNVNKLDESDTVIFVGDCLTQLGELCKSYFPHITAYSIIPDTAFKKVLNNKPTHIVIDGANMNSIEIAHFIQSYFLTKIDEWNSNRITVLEWEPSKRMFPEVHAALIHGINRFIGQLKANIATTVHFGRRWVRNTIRNILADKILYTPTSKLPYVCICAPGPSLRKTVQALPKDIPILSCAAASSLLAGNENVFSAIHTDAGYWAKRHLDNYHQLLAMPLQAAPLPLRKQTRLYQRSFVESLFFKEPQGIVVPEHGSVLGSAIYYAAYLSDGPIYLIGADLSFQNNRFHEKGYRLDSINARKARRSFAFEAFDYIHHMHHSYLYQGERVTRPLQLFAESFSLFPSSITERLSFVGNKAPGVHSAVLSIAEMQKNTTKSKAHHLHFTTHQVSDRSARSTVLHGLHGMKRITIEGDTIQLKKLQLLLAPKTRKQGSPDTIRRALLQEITALERQYT